VLEFLIFLGAWHAFFGRWLVHPSKFALLLNRTTDVLEKRFAAMEGGAAALAVSSGTSACFYAIINLAEQGDNFISARNLYGGTFTQFNDILPKFGIKAKFVYVVCRRQELPFYSEGEISQSLLLTLFTAISLTPRK